MIGVCTGKVRSTPTPKLTFRTVNVSRTPPPCRRITTPWKIWIRSREPSTTRTCTFNVSPGRKSGRSDRSDSASRASRVFIAGLRFLVRQARCSTGRGYGTVTRATPPATTVQSAIPPTRTRNRVQEVSPGRPGPARSAPVLHQAQPAGGGPPQRPDPPPTHDSAVPPRSVQRGPVRSVSAPSCTRPSRPAAVRRSARTRRQRTTARRSEEHTSELQSRRELVCRLLLEKKKKKKRSINIHKKKKKKQK